MIEAFYVVLSPIALVRVKDLEHVVIFRTLG
jgi:hypothetical protein